MPTVAGDWDHISRGWLRHMDAEAVRAVVSQKKRGRVYIADWISGCKLLATSYETKFDLLTIKEEHMEFMHCGWQDEFEKIKDILVWRNNEGTRKSCACQKNKTRRSSSFITLSDFA